MGAAATWDTAGEAAWAAAGAAAGRRRVRDWAAAGPTPGTRARDAAWVTRAWDAAVYAATRGRAGDGQRRARSDGGEVAEERRRATAQQCARHAKVAACELHRPTPAATRKD